MYEASYRVLLLRGVLVRFLQKNRTNRIHGEIYIRGDYYRNWLAQHGSQEVPQSAFCQLENQESWLGNSA